MTTSTIITCFGILLSTVNFAHGLPQVTDATSNNPTVFTPWSSHPDCAAPATACKADCTQAVNQLCNNHDLTTPNIIETVGECTAWYLYEELNTVPTPEQCYSAFAYINDAGKPDPNGCGGTFGGALGWNKLGTRTKDPAFAIFPKSGNGNCFKKTGDNSPPLPQDTLPDGSKIPIDQCPVTTSRRRRQLGSSGDLSDRDLAGCVVENWAFQFGCNAVCLTWVSGLTFGIGLGIGLLPCLGGCSGVAYKLSTNEGCFEAEGHPGGKLKARADEQPKACTNLLKMTWECPIAQQTILDYYKCPANVTSGREVTGARGSGTINT
ncbi:MAG: hypothetical protein Q9219_006476 [cf. Caloplaca sp. 3 TL-2023]